jgi:hypothetical protein
MKKEIGLWIDRRKAVIVILTMKGEVTRRIESDVDKPAYFPPPNSASSSVEEQHRKQLENRLSEYYKRIVSNIRDAESILIFGPGEAKGELEKQLERAGLEDNIVDIQTDEEMTDRQILAKVHRYFPNHRRPYVELEEIPASNSGTPK